MPLHSRLSTTKTTITENNNREQRPTEAQFICDRERLSPYGGKGCQRKPTTTKTDNNENRQRRTLCVLDVSRISYPPHVSTSPFYGRMKAARSTRDAWKSMPDGSFIDGREVSYQRQRNFEWVFHYGQGLRFGKSFRSDRLLHEPGTQGDLGISTSLRCHECNKQCRAPQGHEEYPCAGCDAVLRTE